MGSTYFVALKAKGSLNLFDAHIGSQKTDELEDKFREMSESQGIYDTN